MGHFDDAMCSKCRTLVWGEAHSCGGGGATPPEVLAKWEAGTGHEMARELGTALREAVEEVLNLKTYLRIARRDAESENHCANVVRIKLHRAKATLQEYSAWLTGEEGDLIRETLAEIKCD